jgi:hypothetical protein
METSRKQTQNIQSKIIKILEDAPEVTKRFQAWSKFDDDILRKYYYRKDKDLIAKVLNRSKQAIENRANVIGITQRKK